MTSLVENLTKTIMENTKERPEGKDLTKDFIMPWDKVVMVSGGFDPVHVGHLRMFDEAKLLGDKLIVVLNCDNWLVRKKGKAFMPSVERAELIKGFRSVDFVYVLESDEDHVCEALRLFKPAIFANGGDRKAGNIPEYAVCEELGIEMVFEVGGGKIQSSSELLKKYEDNGKE